MTVYWDSSAIVTYYAQAKVGDISGVTRVHSLAEVFSALTGGGFLALMPDGYARHKKLNTAAGALVVSRIFSQLKFIELTADETLAAIKDARKKGAPGGRVHDLLHAVAAEKAKADELWTGDRHDFTGLGHIKLKVI